MIRILKTLGLIVLAALPAAWLLVEGRPGAVLITDGRRDLADEDWRRAARFVWEEAPELPTPMLEAVSGAARSPLDGQLYFSGRDREGWDLFRLDDRSGRAPERLLGLSSPAGDRDLQLSSDGRRLFFASDRRGGAGGYDLYVCRWKGDDFGPPERLAPACGPADERRPAPRPEGGVLFLRPGETHLLYWLSDDGEAAGLATLPAPWDETDDVGGLTVAGDGRLFYSARGAGDRDFDLHRSLPDGPAWARGRPIRELSTPLDELDPACDGLGLGFRREGGRAPEFSSETIRAREREIESRPLGPSLRVALLKALFGLIAAVLALLLILRWRRLHPFFKFLLVSIILHLLALLFVDPVGAPGESSSGRGRVLRVTWLGDESTPVEGSGEPAYLDNREFIASSSAPAVSRLDAMPTTDARSIRRERETLPRERSELPAAVTLEAARDLERPRYELAARASTARATIAVREPQAVRAEPSRAEETPRPRGEELLVRESWRVGAGVGGHSAEPAARSFHRSPRAGGDDLAAEQAALARSGTERAERQVASPASARPLISASRDEARGRASRVPVAGAGADDRVTRKDVLGVTPGPAVVGEFAVGQATTALPAPAGARAFLRPRDGRSPPGGEEDKVEAARIPARRTGAPPRRPLAATSERGGRAGAETAHGAAVAAPDFRDLASGAVTRAAPTPGGLALGLAAPDDRLAPRSFRRPRSALEIPQEVPEVATYAARTGGLKARALELGGGGVETEAAVLAGLRYLAGVQNEDGSWGPRGRHSKYRDRRAGKTGLALLAYLGAGHDHQRDSEFQSVVARGLDFLRGRQSRENGHIGDGSSYGHGIATYSLAEAYAMTRDDRLRPPLRRAIKRILDAQFRDGGSRLDGGWGYYYRDPERRFDAWPRLSVTVWQIMALESGRLGGLLVPEAALRRARDFVLASDDPSMAALRYNHDPEWRRNSYPTLPGSNSAALFAMQLLDVPPDHPAHDRALDFVRRRPPDFAWRKAGNSRFVGRGESNLYFHYYAALAMHRRGGEDWAAWNARLKPLLLDNQQRDGSWRPISAYAEYAGDDARDRSYTTAMAVLMLEVYYRYFTPLLASLNSSPVPEVEAALEKAVFELSGIRRGSAAERAGLRDGDGIIALDDAEIHDVAALRAALDGWTATRAIEIRLLRGEEVVVLGPLTRVGGFKIRRRR